MNNKISTTLPGPASALENETTPTLASRVAAVRLSMIDIAKGMGILLIVFGHDVRFGHRYDEVAELLAGIRLPFFFFISGVTFSIGQRTWSQIAIIRADAWIKPFMVVVFAFGVLNILRGTGTWESTALAMIYGVGYTLSPRAVWFLPHLWLVYVFCAAIMIYAGRFLNTAARRVSLLSLLLVAGYLFLDVFDTPYENNACFKVSSFQPVLFDCGLPFSADFLLLTSVFFLAGHFLARQAKNFQFNAVFFVASIAGIALLRIIFGDSMNLNYRQYDGLFTTTALAGVGIYFMLCVSQLLSRSVGASGVLTFVGRGSLFILLFHMPILYQFPPLLQRFIASPDVVAIISLLCAVVIPLGLWKLSMKFAITRVLFFPVVKFGRRPAPLAVPATVTPS